MESGFSHDMVYVFIFFYEFLGWGKYLQVLEVYQYLEKFIFSGY